MKALSALIIATSLITTHATLAWGQSPDDDHHLTLGVFAFTEPSIYVGGKDTTSVIPYFDWEWHNWFFRDFSFGTYLAATDNWYLSSAIALDAFGDVSRGDSKSLKDMEKLKDIYTFVVSTGLYGELGELSLSYSQDVSGNHNGGYAQLNYQYTYRLRKWSINPHVSLTYANAPTIRYFMGVDADEVNASRPLYQPNGAYTYETGVAISRLFGRSHRFLVNLNHRYYSNEVHNSPIINREHIWSVGAGYLYEF